METADTSSSRFHSSVNERGSLELELRIMTSGAEQVWVGVLSQRRYVGKATMRKSQPHQVLTLGVRTVENRKKASFFKNCCQNTEARSVIFIGDPSQIWGKQSRQIHNTGGGKIFVRSIASTGVRNCVQKKRTEKLKKGNLS